MADEQLRVEGNCDRNFNAHRPTLKVQHSMPNACIAHLTNDYANVRLITDSKASDFRCG